MSGKVFIPQPVDREGERYLEERGYQIVRGCGKTDKESLKKDIAECDAMLLRTLRIDREVLSAAKRLKVVARHGAGYDNLDWQAAKIPWQPFLPYHRTSFLRASSSNRPSLA